MAAKPLSATRTINAPKSEVWAVLADFGNIASWTGQVQKSYITNDTETGVGAARHCDLSGRATLEETIVDFVPEARLGISIDSGEGVPIKSSLSAFELREIDAGTTEVTMTADPVLKGGPVAPLLRKAAGGKLTKGLADLLDDLAAAVEAKTPAA